MYATQSRSLSSETPLTQIARLVRLAHPLVSQAIQRQTLALSLNHCFLSAVRQGDLDFLRGRQARITIPDINVDFVVTLRGQRLQVSLTPLAPDVSFRADTRSLLRIVAGQVDPDTLFFRRKLAIEGDTELGLALKNFLDSQDPEQLIPGALYRLITRAVTRSPTTP